jgi:hypothetical protein
MPTAYKRLAEVRRKRRFTVIAGRPIAEPPGNPWADIANDERRHAAAFADRVVGAVCIAVALWAVATYIAPDVAAWLNGSSVVLVAR